MVSLSFSFQTDQSQGRYAHAQVGQWGMYLVGVAAAVATVVLTRLACPPSCPLQQVLVQTVPWVCPLQLALLHAGQWRMYLVGAAAAAATVVLTRLVCPPSCLPQQVLVQMAPLVYPPQLALLQVGLWVLVQMVPMVKVVLQMLQLQEVPLATDQVDQAAQQLHGVHADQEIQAHVVQADQADQAGQADQVDQVDLADQAAGVS